MEHKNIMPSGKKSFSIGFLVFDAISITFRNDKPVEMGNRLQLARRQQEWRVRVCEYAAVTKGNFSVLLQLCITPIGIGVT